jgi:hypothetical protein
VLLQHTTTMKTPLVSPAALIPFILFADVQSFAFVAQSRSLSVHRNIRHKNLSSITPLRFSSTSPEPFEDIALHTGEESVNENSFAAFGLLSLGVFSSEALGSIVLGVVNLAAIYVCILFVLTGLSLANDVITRIIEPRTYLDDKKRA